MRFDRLVEDIFKGASEEEYDHRKEVAKNMIDPGLEEELEIGNVYLTLQYFEVDTDKKEISAGWFPEMADEGDIDEFISLLFYLIQFNFNKKIITKKIDLKNCFIEIKYEDKN